MTTPRITPNTRTQSTIVIVSAAERDNAHQYGLTLTDEQISALGLLKSKYDYPCTVELRAAGTDTPATHYFLHCWATPDELSFLQSYPEHLMVSVDVNETTRSPKEHRDNLLTEWALELVPQPLEP